MAITSLKPFVGVPADSVDHYHGDQLNYVTWDRHLMFAAPFILCLSPQLPFGDLVKGPISDLIKADPDAKDIDWTRVQWLKSNQTFVPEFDKTLAANGVLHKEQLRFHTPGLNSLGLPAHH
jgi:phenol hydroxylase P4 protein